MPRLGEVSESYAEGYSDGYWSRFADRAEADYAEGFVAGRAARLRELAEEQAFHESVQSYAGTLPRFAEIMQMGGHERSRRQQEISSAFSMRRLGDPEKQRALPPRHPPGGRDDWLAEQEDE